MSKYHLITAICWFKNYFFRISKILPRWIGNYESYANYDNYFVLYSIIWTAPLLKLFRLVLYGSFWVIQSATSGKIFKEHSRRNLVIDRKMLIKSLLIIWIKYYHKNNGISGVNQCRNLSYWGMTKLYGHSWLWFQSIALNCADSYNIIKYILYKLHVIFKFL
jgi:hypothetical protein